MLIVAIVCFVAAIILGLVMLTHLALNKKFSRIIPLTHGALALLGIIFLTRYTISNAETPFVVVTVFFFLVAFGGLYLFSKDLRGKRIPRMIAVAHGSLALISFLLLVIFAVS